MGLNLSFGGADNEYVSAAAKAAGSGSPFSLIASLLDAVGIGRQVAKEPKPDDLADSQTPDAKAEKQSKKLTQANQNSKDPVDIPAISQAETALGVTPLPLSKPIEAVDPSISWLNGMFDSVLGKK